MYLVTTTSPEQIPHEGRRQPVSVYRLRDRYVNDFLQKFPRENGHAIAPAQLIDGFFYPIPGEPEPPGWLPAVNSILLTDAERPVSLVSQHPGGLLFVQYQTKTFIFSFGHAWSSLKEEWVEPNFGMRVALNSIPRNQLTELKAEQVFAAWHLSNERAPTPTSLTKFGLEADRDLVHGIEGKPTAPIGALLGVSIRGSISLKISMDFLRMKEVLDLIIGQEQKTDYKQIWPEIDNLSLVRDEATTALLEQNLATELCDAQRVLEINLVAPSLKNIDTIIPSSYVIGQLRSHGSSGIADCPYLLIGNWLSYVAHRNEAPCVANAKTTAVHLLDDGKKEIARIRIYDCIGFETSITNAGNTINYVLSAGRWYEASNSFINNINATLGTLVAPSSHLLPIWNSVHREDEYNKSCIVSGNRNGMYLFDAKNIHFGGGQSKFEFCDLFHEPSKTLYFVKHVCASNHFSHLSEQVRRTVELVFGPTDDFRKKLSLKITELYPSLDTSWLTNQRPRQGEVNICIVSMGKHFRDYPFFAKCGLVRLLKELRHANHNVTFLAV